jgi:hypothetical protein
MSISELITNIENDKKNIIIDTSDKDDSIFNRLNIYNADINQPLHKFWFYIDNVKIMSKSKSQFKIIFSSSELHKKLVNYITDLDNKILEIIKKRHNVKTIKPSIETTEHLPSQINLRFDSVAIFDEDENNILPDNLKLGSSISMYFELNECVLNNKSAWLNWSALQVKVNKKIDFSKSFFNFTQMVEPKIVKPTIILPPPAPIMQVNTQPMVICQPIQNNSQNSSKNTGSYIPTANDLLSQLKKLKKVKDVQEETPKEPSSPNPLTALKKVITKEPLSVHDIYKLEMDEQHKINQSKEQDSESEKSVPNKNNEKATLSKNNKFGKSLETQMKNIVSELAVFKKNKIETDSKYKKLKDMIK